TFFASLRLSDEQEIDARPSDAIALAIRFSVPIWVAESVMTEASFLPEEGEEEEGSEDEEEDLSLAERLSGKSEEKPAKQPAKPMTHLDQLNQQLAEAIRKEEYERAAKLRDDIQKLQTTLK
ncbi:MAG TPA: bifunctional nuclease domain-containing protein, partial [Candidatus Kapabacteria bacterium]